MKARLLLLVLLLPLLTFGQSANAPAYRRKAGTLTVANVIERGLVVLLSDGSGWEVRPEDRGKSDTWQRGKKVGVYATDDATYPYRLIYDPAMRDTTVVSAKYLKRL
jgi:hypothetical protein